jgi:hypothetical protein
MAASESYFLDAVFDRRDFLKKSLLGSLLFGSAGFVASCKQRAAVEVRPEGVLILNVAEFRTLTKFCRAVLPEADSPASQAVPYRIDREISYWQEKNQAQVKSLLALIEQGTKYFFYSWHSFRELPTPRQQDYLHGWESSRFGFRRQAFQALRMMAFFYFYAQDATWKTIGYDGPWVKQERQL